MKDRHISRPLLVALAAITLFASCASIVSQSSYPLIIHSTPKGAQVVISNKKGQDIYTGITPTIVHLDASAGFFSKEKYTVRFTLPEHKEQILSVNTRLDAWYFGNIMVGGVIGMLIIDPATGAMWKLSQDYISANLTPLSTTNELHVMDIKEVPEEWKEHLVEVDLSAK